MEYYIINVRNFKNNADTIQSENISQNIQDHADNAVISSSEVTLFLLMCMGLTEMGSVYDVMFTKLKTQKGYGIQISYIDSCMTEIKVQPYAENINTSMINDIMEAFIAAGMFFVLPLEEVGNE